MCKYLGGKNEDFVILTQNEISGNGRRWAPCGGKMHQKMCAGLRMSKKCSNFASGKMGCWSRIKFLEMDEGGGHADGGY